MAPADKAKLDGVESGATADQTAGEILDAVKSVDGAGSGLDADLLDGVQASSFARYTNAHTTSDPNVAPEGFSSGDSNIDGATHGWHWIK